MLLTGLLSPYGLQVQLHMMVFWAHYGVSDACQEPWKVQGVCRGTVSSLEIGRGKLAATVNSIKWWPVKRTENISQEGINAPSRTLCVFRKRIPEGLSLRLLAQTSMTIENTANTIGTGSNCHRARHWSSESTEASSVSN